MVLLGQSNRLAGAYGEVFERLRYNKAMLPRILKMIVGSSCLGDIEQTPELGAHNPRYLHVGLVEDGT